MFSSHGRMGFAVILWSAVTLLTVSSALGAGTITENFNNNHYNQDLWRVSNIGTGVTSTIVNNRAEVTLPASAGGSLYMGMMGSRLTVAGDFDMQVDFALLTWPANNAAQVGLTLEQANDFSIFRRSRGVNEGGGGDIYFTVIKGQMTQVPASGTSGKLRMTRTGNTMQGYYWDGAAWQLVGSAADPSLGAATHVMVNLNRDTSFSGPIVKAAFDNIQLAYTNWMIYEGFDDNQYQEDLFWMNTSGVGSADLANQELQVTIPANDGVAFAVAGLENRLRLAGDFDMQVDFSLPTWPAGNGVNAGIISPLCSVTRHSFHDNFSGDVDAYLAALPPGQESFWVNTTDSSGKLRLRRTGNTVEAFYWLSGAWQSMGSNTDPQLGAPIEVYIGACSGGGAYGPTKTVTATFDNYVIIFSKVDTGPNPYSPGALMLLLE